MVGHIEEPLGTYAESNMPADNFFVLAPDAGYEDAISAHALLSSEVVAVIVGMH